MFGFDEMFQYILQSFSFTEEYVMLLEHNVLAFPSRTSMNGCEVHEDANIIQKMNLENNENNLASRSHITLTFLGED